VRVWRRNGTGGEQWAARLEHLQGHTNWRCNDVETLFNCLHNLITPHDSEGTGSGAPEREWALVRPDDDEPPLPHQEVWVVAHRYHHIDN